MHSLFAYGTLRCDEIMRLVAGHIPPSEKAQLHDYRSLYVRGEVYPAVTECEGHSVEGILYTDISDEMLAALDEFEGEIYERKRLTVKTESGFANPWVYVIAETSQQLLDGREWDYGYFLEHEKENFVKAIL